MGFKRPIEDGDLKEFPLKHSKQVNLGNDVTSFSQNFPDLLEDTPKTDVPGEDDLYFKIQYDDSDDSKEDTGSGSTYFSPFSPDFVDFHFPRRLVPQFKDTYSCLLEGPPRKQVHVGEDYQALVPAWDPQAVFDNGDEKLMGDIVHSPLDEYVAVHARKCSTCLDDGSIRCVQQHVKEAREALRVTLGDEKFAKLGFHDMGEDVSEKWSEEEERVFHEVVYTKSVSHGKDFWDSLSAVFPSRNKSKIVSYYFNVFMLRRRFVQNRSMDLEIDSDNDDWDESYWSPLGFEQDNEEDLDDVDSDGVDNDNGKKDCKVNLVENGDGSANGWDPGFISCKGKAWDDYFSMSPIKFVDHPPTPNMMDEIFGPSPKNNGVNGPFM